MLFKSSFQILADFLTNCYQQPTCGKMTTTWCKRFFYECVVCVCFSFATIFFFIAFLLALGFLMGVMSTSFALPIFFIQISLEFRKWLVYKDFILKDTKLLL